MADRIQAERITSALTRTEFAAVDARSTFMMLLSGCGQYRSDDIERDVVAPCIIWAPSGWSARTSLDAGTRGIVLRIPETALGRALPSGAIAAHVRQIVSQRFFLTDPPMERIPTFQGLFDNVERELLQQAPGDEMVLHHYISLLLIEIWRSAAPPLQTSAVQPHHISDRFLNLMEIHLQSHWPITKYAQRIGVSRDRLNVAVRRATGVSPHELLQRRLIEEAKALLVSSTLNVAEVGYKLGFSDPSYFSRFFQRNTSMPPGKFRQSYTSLYRSIEAEVSFAEWP